MEKWEMALKGLTLDPNDHLAYSYAGIAELWSHRFNRAFEATRRTIEINPNFADGYR